MASETVTTTAVELQSLDHSLRTVSPESPIEDANEHEMASLPQVDGGKDAWLFLAACFLIEGLVWGFGYSFGVFQAYYSTHEPFASSGNTAVVGTCAMGIMYLDTPLVMGLHRRYPRQARHSTIVGLLIMCLALGLSSFCTTLPQLIATQGLLYALGGSIAYASTIAYLPQWFPTRRGLAFGIMWSATGLSGVLLPLLLQRLLAAYGHATTLRIIAGIFFAMTAPLAWFVRPRVPVSLSTTGSAGRRARPWAELSWVVRRPFVGYQVWNVVQAVGFFLPGVYLPSFARGVLGVGEWAAVGGVMLVNVASVFGCVGMGQMVDRLEVTTCLLVSAAGAAVGTVLLWGMAVDLAVLYVFCVVYGLFAGAYTSAWPGIMNDVTRRGLGEESGKSVDSSMVFAFLAMGRGVGNVVSGPLSEVLIKDMPWKGEAFGGYGSGYGGLIAFTGVTAALGGGSFLWKRLGWL